MKQEDNTSLLFAPLIRVSTEQQAKQGESLRTQKEQLLQAIQSFNGRIYKWYEGHEHATQNYERKILEQLMQDAKEKKFNAIMVADLSRWSRDNAKSKQYTKILQNLGIRFFEGTMEHNLYNPNSCLILGMGVEIQEFFAKQQKYKSAINRVKRAKDGRPSCGKKPFGRIWNKVTLAWEIDEKKQAIINEAARLYLEENYSWKQLGERFGMNGPNLHKIVCYRSGDNWSIHFKDEDFNIDETHTLNIPPLLSKETIIAIRRKCEARRTYDHKTQKHQYLFSRLIFDTDSGFALTGTSNKKGTRYYKPYQGCKRRYHVNADALEKAVLDELLSVLGRKASLREAVFNGNPLGKVAEDLRIKLKSKQGELKATEKRIKNLLSMLKECEDEDDGIKIRKRIKPEWNDLEDKATNIKEEIDSILLRLNSLPTDKEIETERGMWAKLILRQKEDYLRSGVPFEKLPFEEKKKIIHLLFGGKDEMGKRYGIYIQELGGKPKGYRFYAYGKLGAVEGYIAARTGDSYAFADFLLSSPLEGNKEITANIGKVISQEYPELAPKREKVAEDMHEGS
ncbi:MAG: recombinase family protein [Nitrososphaeria archaeon]|jgi:DNA invertase Pin-like site-specific DNA recombinase